MTAPVPGTVLPALDDLRRAPRRIVCIAPSNTEILYALGAQDRVVGVSRYCDFPAAARSKPRCGGFLDPRIDDILALRPDLVLAQSFLQEDAVKALVHAEVRVLASGATSLAGVLQDVLVLGRLVEREEEADALVARMHGELAELAACGDELARAAGRRPRVYLEEWGPSEPYFLAGDWAAEMLALAGADNAFAGRPLRCPSPERRLTAEEIAAADPRRDRGGLVRLQREGGPGADRAPAGPGVLPRRARRVAAVRRRPLRHAPGAAPARGGAAPASRRLGVGQTMIR